MTESQVGTVGITGASGYPGGVIRDRLGAAGWSCVQWSTAEGPSARRFSFEEDLPSDLLDQLDVLVHCAYDMSARTREDIWKTT